MKIWCTVFFCTCYFVAVAQNENKKDSLLSVKVFSVPYKTTRYLPVSYSELNRKTIQLFNQGQEVSQLINQLPAVTAYTENGTGMGYSSLRVRGIDQNRINITFNGLPLNEPEDQGVYFSNFPDLLSNVSTIQLQRGMGLSKNGVSAFAGSLDFNLQQPDSLRLLVNADYGSYNSARFQVQQNLQTGKHQFGYNLSNISSDGFRNASNNNSSSAMFRWNYRNKNNLWQYVLLGGLNRNGLSWLGVTDSILQKNRNANGNSILEKSYFSQLVQQLHYTRFIKNNQRLNISGFFNYTDGKYDFDLMNFLGFPSSGKTTLYHTYSSFSGLQINYNYTTEKLNLSLGGFGSLYKKTHNGLDNPGEKLLYSNYGIKNEFSAFAKFLYAVNKFSFFADLQYRTTSFRYSGDVKLKDFNWAFVNPLAGVNYKLNTNSLFYYSIGRNHREPGRNDIFKGNDNLGSDANGNAVFADLLAERNFSQELGYRFYHKQIQLSVNYYRMSLQNEITLNGQIGPTGIPLRSNVATTVRQGIEVEYRLPLNKYFTLEQNFAWSNHRTKQAGVSFTPLLSPNFIGNTNLYFQYRQLQLVLQNKIQSASYINFANTNQIPDFVAFNFHAIYAIKRVQLSARLFNITNQVIYANGQLNVYGKPIFHIQAPFNLMFGVRYALN